MSFSHPDYDENVRGARSRITKFVVTETAIYPNHFRRPYKINANIDTFEDLLDRLKDTTAVTPGTISRFSSGLVMPSITPEGGIVRIANGFNTRRLRFYMEFEHTTYTNDVYIQHISGFSDIPGLAYSQTGRDILLDPDTEFTINSTYTTKEIHRNTPLGNRSYYSITDSSTLLSNADFDGVRNKSSHKYRLRPEDVFASIGRDSSLEMQDIFDGRATTTTKPVKSRKNNLSIPSYLSKILDGHKRASILTDYDQPDEYVHSQARGHVGENAISNDYFLKELSKVTSGYTSTFTFRDLVDIDPGVDDIYHYTMMSTAERDATHYDEEYDDMAEASTDNQIATIIGQTIAAILGSTGISIARVIVEEPPGSFMMGYEDITIDDITILNAKSLGSGNLADQLDICKTRILEELLMGIYHLDKSPLYLDVTYDQLGDTRVRFEYDGYSKGPFIIAQFCDSIHNSLETTRKETVTDIAHDVSLIFKAVNAEKDREDTLRFTSF